MCVLELIRPEKSHKKAAEEYKQEFFDNGEHVINGSSMLDQVGFEEWLINTEKNSDPKNKKPDWVTTDTFFAVRKEDGKIIGMIDIRHSIDHPFLSQYGGHIGYSIRPSERRRGYATKMLELALLYAKTLGLKKVMLGCYCDNIGSNRTIQKCGGVLTEAKPYTDGTPMNVYWIEL